MSESNDAAAQSTHRVHWKVSCDARRFGHGFQIARDHAGYIRQASGCFEGGLISERCHFGPRRLILEGEVLYEPPRWHASRPSAYGHDLADNMARWTLKTLYGMGTPGVMLHEMDEPSNMVIHVRVYPIAQAA